MVAFTCFAKAFALASALLFVAAGPVFARGQEAVLASAEAVERQPADAVFRVLMLSSFNQDTAPYAAVRAGLILELQSRLPHQVKFQQFDLQQRQVGSDDSETLRAELLYNLYRETPPHLVIAIGPPAAKFWLDQRDSMFPEARTLLTASELMLSGLPLRPGDSFVANHFTYPTIVDHILQVLPDTRRMLLVFGGTDNERQLANAAKESLRGYEQRIDFAYTNDMPLRTLQHTLASLEPGAAVLLGIFDSDVDGMVLGNQYTLSLVKAASQAPVFGFFEDQLGKGIVGGPLIPVQDTITALASTAIELLKYGESRGRRKVLPLNQPAYDWREMQRWNIDPARLPGGSDILFKPPALWEQYRLLIVAAAVVLLLQAALIMGLLLQRWKKQLAEGDNVRLRRRLITAHEDEQRRIARELHDDLAQRLARLSIDAGYLASNPGNEAAAEVARDMQPRLISLSKDVHDMSVLLHPSMIDDLGIAAALNSECDRIRRHQTAAIVTRIGEIPRSVPHEIALAVFRIGQEGLNNAIRHAHATRIELSLAFDGNWFTLKVEDDGMGFDAASGLGNHGLGLFSMQERAALVNGRFSINSKPGRGTTLLVRIPFKAAPA